jgi:hypothetical protein
MKQLGNLENFSTCFREEGNEENLRRYACPQVLPATNRILASLMLPKEFRGPL